MDFSPFIKRYEDELVGQVIPFWEQHGVDHEYGGYFTSLDRDGSVYDTEKYMWMQWRIVYMFATLYTTPWLKPYRKEAWLDIARQGFDFLTAHGKDADGAYYFALNRKGDPTIAPYNIFSNCFAAMGAAALYKATGEQRYRDEADSAMKCYIRRMDDPKGRWDKSMPARASRLSHGHYMMLANLGCVMEDCLNTDEYRDDAAAAINAVLEKFWNPHYRVLFENVNPDGSYDLDSCEGRFVNPGHGLESMWFVMNYAERENRPDLIAKAADIVKAQLEFGKDPEYGGIFYFMDVLHKPHLELQWDMKLWWVHNEAILATLFAYRLTGQTDFLNLFMDLDQWTWGHFKDPSYPEWFAYLNRRGEPTHMLKGGKWKTMFHLPRCLLIAVEQMKKMP